MNLIFDQKERVAEYLVNKKAGNNFHNYQAIGVEKDGKLIGGVLYDSYEIGYRCAMSCAGETGWLSRKNLRIFFDYPFNQLKVNVITATALSKNVDSCRVLEGCGFKEMARIPECSALGDLIIYAMYRDDCKYLKGKK